MCVYSIQYTVLYCTYCMSVSVLYINVARWYECCELGNDASYKQCNTLRKSPLGESLIQIWLTQMRDSLIQIIRT